MTCPTPTCGRENRADARFCDACGAKLHPTTALFGERRQLTLLFCDIVDYTSLSQILDDDEVLHPVIGEYRRAVSDVIARLEGQVKDHRGDDVCAYFGYPQAHEDDAERAVRAGLEIVQKLAALNLQALDARHALPSLAVRIGIHTGPVTVAELGSDERGDRQPLGPTLNLAARLQASAPPGAVVVSDATKQLVSGMFLTEDMGLLELKGIRDPVRAHIVLESTGVRGRLDAQAYAAPFVGRARQIASLRRSWQDARDGRGQVVLISGIAGIGKSRLVRRFTELVTTAKQGVVFEWRCSFFHTSTPFHPIIEAIEHHLGTERGAGRDQIGPRIRALLTSTGLRLEGESDLIAASGLIADLVSPGTLDSETTARETPPGRRSRTLNALCEIARAQARRQPSVMVVDDLQWADPSTIDLLGRLIQRASDVPLLLLLAFRADFVPPWGTAEHVRALALKPLTLSRCAELFDALVGSRSMLPAVRTELLSRADGVPLFIEELTRTVLDPTTEGTGNTTSRIPGGLQGLLASRIDHLSGGAGETIRLASAFSREFAFELLASVSEKKPLALRHDLQELVQAGLVYRRRARDRKTYTFKHALVAEAAYSKILPADRRRLHGQIAHRLSDAFPALATERPELLAHHFGEAGETETAIDHWRRAGDAAIARGAYQEAVRHFDHGLELLPQLSGDGPRLHHEIGLTESKGTALFSMRGYAHPEVERTFAHASSLCEREGSSPSLRVLYGLWAVHITRGNREAIEALLPRFQELARSGDPVALLTAHANAGVFAFFSGDFEQCLARMTEATRWYATSEHSAFLRRHGYGGGLYPFAWRMWSLSILGRVDQALIAEKELQTLAEQAANPYGLAIACGFRINLARDRRNLKETLELADRQIEYTQRQILPFWEGPAHCSRGWARACLGDVADGIAEIGLGLHYLDAVGLRATYSYQLGGLAEALLLAGDVTGARAAAERGLAMCESTLNRFYEAELLRLQAESDRRLGDVASAESGFTRALDVARRQSATLMALRAAESLARLLIDDGRGDRARQELESVLSGISEGLDMADVANARRLLNAIA